MAGMGPPPLVVGCQRDNADQPADPVIGNPSSKEGTVTAIMLDHEEPDEECSCRHHQYQPKPVALVQQKAHSQPKRNQGDRGNYNFDDAPELAWLVIGGKNVPPPRRIHLRTIPLRIQTA
jgi:hypothetical protein